jgi:hypothetical protein
MPINSGALSDAAFGIIPRHVWTGLSALADQLHHQLDIGSDLLRRDELQLMHSLAVFVVTLMN